MGWGFYACAPSAGNKGDAAQKHCSSAIALSLALAPLWSLAVFVCESV